MKLEVKPKDDATIIFLDGYDKMVLNVQWVKGLNGVGWYMIQTTAHEYSTGPDTNGRIRLHFPVSE